MLKHMFILVILSWKVSLAMPEALKPLHCQRLANSRSGRHEGRRNDNANDSDNGNCTHFPSVCAMPGTVLSSSHAVSRLILPAA